MVEADFRNLAGLQLMDTGYRTGRNKLSGLERNPPPCHQLEKEAGRADRAIGEARCPAVADFDVIDRRRDLPFLEAATAPVRDFWADHQAFAVAGIGPG